MDLLTKAAMQQKRWKSGMSDETIIRIAEFIIRDVRSYSENVIECYGIVDEKDTEEGIRIVRETMSSDFYNCITMGHGADALKDFNDRLIAHGIAL